MPPNKEKPHIPGSQLEKPPFMRAVQPFTKEEMDQVVEETGRYPTIADAFGKAGGVGAGLKQLKRIPKKPREAYKIFAQAVKDGARCFHFLVAVDGDRVPCIGSDGFRYYWGWIPRDHMWKDSDRVVLID